MAVHSDMVLLLDEANLFGMGETARALAAMFKDVAFKLGSGTTKARMGSEGGEKRLLFLSTSNEPLASLIGEHSEGAKAAADRLITIPIPEDRPYGVLDFVPAGYSSPGAFVDAVMSATQNYCGQALPRFLAKLVNERARDEAGLRRKIAGFMEVFRERSGVDNNSGSARRIADAFGLVYAAGKLAEKYRAIPRHYNCGLAVMACYQHHLGRAQAGLSFADRLERLSRRQDVPHLGKGRAPALMDAEYETGIFIKEGRNGHELLIRADRIERHIPDWKHIRGREEVQSLLISEKIVSRLIASSAADMTGLGYFAFPSEKIRDRGRGASAPLFLSCDPRHYPFRAVRPLIMSGLSDAPESPMSMAKLEQPPFIRSRAISQQYKNGGRSPHLIWCNRMLVNIRTAISD